MMEAVRQRSKTYDLVYVSIFVVLIAVCSWISIPLTVPVTLQTFGVFIAVGLLGGKRGTLAVLVYILMGAIGIPVFSGFTGGIGILAGTTGGYIVGFLFSALLMWGMEKLFGKGCPWKKVNRTDSQHDRYGKSDTSGRGFRAHRTISNGQKPGDSSGERPNVRRRNRGKR